MPIGNKNLIIPGCGTHHISIHTDSWDPSIHFYKDVLGMKIVAQFGSSERPMALLDIGDGTHIELAGSAKQPDASDVEPGDVKKTGVNPIAHLALATTDTLKAIEHVRLAGYQVTVEPRTVDLNGMVVTIAFFKGPNNEEIEFFQTH